MDKDKDDQSFRSIKEQQRCVAVSLHEVSGKWRMGCTSLDGLTNINQYIKKLEEQNFINKT